jgi:hypothetical protein
MTEHHTCYNYLPSAVILIRATSAGVPTKAPIPPAVIPLYKLNTSLY